MFACESEADDETDGDESWDGRTVRVAVEGVDGPEHETGLCGVGCNECGVSEQGGVEGDESEGDEAGSRAEHFARGEKDENGQRERQQGGCHAGAEEDGVRVVLEDEVFSADDFLEPVGAVEQGRHLEGHTLEWKSCQKFEERRMLGIETEVALPLHVGGVGVVGFIPRGRVCTRHEGELQADDSKEECNGDNDKSAAKFHFRVESSDHRLLYYANGGRGRLRLPNRFRA